MVSAYKHQRIILGPLESHHLDGISSHQRRNHDISPRSLPPGERSVRETSQSPVARVPADDHLVIDMAVSFVRIGERLGLG